MIAGTQHGGRAGATTDPGPNVNPRNPHNPMPAVRALLVALDEWVVSGKEPPPSRVPTLAAGTLVEPDKTGFPAVPGAAVVKVTNQVAPPGDWVNPKPADKAYRTLVCKVDADGNEAAGMRLPDIAVPLATYSGWNEYKPPYPKGELADRDGSCLPFAVDKAAREAAGDPRPSIAERYTERRRLCRQGRRPSVVGPAEGPAAAGRGRRTLSRAGPPRAARRAVEEDCHGQARPRRGQDPLRGPWSADPTLLLSHGYSSTARMWDGQVAALKDRYQVIVWDMRGHGESDYPTDARALFRGADRGRHEGAARPGRARRRRSSPACRSAATCRSPSTPAIPSGCAR